ncbi:MAG: tetratricopeptide repeat protein [Candidatus Acidoferrales bacterium]
MAIRPPARNSVLLVLGLFLAAAAASPAFGQTPSEVRLDSSPQLFTVLCAVRAAGMRSGRAGADPVNAAVQRALARVPPDQVAALRAFFTDPEHANPAEHLSPYISVGLVLQRPPELEWVFPRQQLPPDVWEVQTFQPLLREFYARAELGPLWRQVQPFYERVIAQRQAEVSQALLETRGYLRMIGESYPGRTYTIYLEWLVPPGLTSARNYGESYFLVIHPARSDLLKAVRHQYLHFLLDPLVAKHAEAFRTWAGLLPRAGQAPRLPQPFREDVLLLVTESLIQAVELRRRRLEPRAAVAELDDRERSGYIFARHFFYALERYEQEEPSIRYYFPELLQGFDVAAERARLERVEFAPLPAEPVPSPPPPETPEETARHRLVEAEQSVVAGDYAAARQGFERVLELNPREPRALYGLAILASLEEDREAAKRYFLRVLREAREPRILGWTHIYLGRIYDLEGRRQEAVAHYRGALALNTRLEKVNEAARRGLEHPFGQTQGLDP